MALKFIPETILLLKVDCFEETLNQNKIDRMVIISHGYWENYWCYSYPDTTLLLHIYGFVAYLSRYKIDEMVNNHSNSCK